LNNEKGNNMKDELVLSIANEAIKELYRATEMNGPFASAHEGYAILLEEMDELKEEIWKKEKLRDKDKMRTEAIQIAAMSIRFVLDVCEKK
jgi:hypothetical protein